VKGYQQLKKGVGGGGPVVRPCARQSRVHLWGKILGGNDLGREAGKGGGGGENLEVLAQPSQWPFSQEIRREHHRRERKRCRVMDILNFVWPSLFVNEKACRRGLRRGKGGHPWSFPTALALPNNRGGSVHFREKTRKGEEGHIAGKGRFPLLLY